MSSRPNDGLLGTAVIGYTLTRRIGAGGMGAVYAAENARIGRRAVVKVLLPNSEAGDRERLEAEGRAANAIRHPGIIDIFGFGVVPDGREAIVMEYLEGQALDEALDAAPEHRLPGRVAVRLLDEIADALGAAHQAGVVHRDLKPSNIFLVDQPNGVPKVKVLDFGIAKRLGRSDGPKTDVQVVLGTPSYMAPEQVRGEAANPSMDLYALGVIAFQLFTGRLPFEHQSLGKLLMAQHDAPPPRPSGVLASLPPEVDAFVLALLEKDPEARPATASAVRQALEPLKAVFPAQEQIQTKKHPAHPVKSQPPTNPPKPVATGRAVTALLAVLAFLGVAVVWWVLAPPEPRVVDVDVVVDEEAGVDAGAVAAVLPPPDSSLLPPHDAGHVALAPAPVPRPPERRPAPRPTPRPVPPKPVVEERPDLEDTRHELEQRMRRLAQLARGQRRRGGGRVAEFLDLKRRIAAATSAAELKRLGTELAALEAHLAP